MSVSNNGSAYNRNASTNKTYYVDPEDYRYYFREGFRRGYEDGYSDQYGYVSNGSYGVLGTARSTILNLQAIR